MHDSQSISNELPTRYEAEEILREAETHNIGLWGRHSRNVAMCAEKIAVAWAWTAIKRISWDYYTI